MNYVLGAGPGVGEPARGCLARTIGLLPWLPESEIAATAPACERWTEGVRPGPNLASTCETRPLPTHTVESQPEPQAAPEKLRPRRGEWREWPEHRPGAARRDVPERAGLRCFPGSGGLAR